MAGAAARPVITPTMIVIDHGKVFTSQTFLNACAYLGISVRPARVRTPTDKAVIERTFASLKSLFCQFVAGYTGSDITRRGKAVDKGRLWRIDQINDLLQEFLCLVWQQRPHEGLRNPFHPAMPALAPNQAYAAHVTASGYLPVPLSDTEVLHLLPVTWARVSDKGVRWNRRTYDGPQLNPYRGASSGLFGRNRMRWEVRYNPYQPETVWLRDHRSDEWVPVDFIHKDLLGDKWTEWVWEQATDDFLARDGRPDDERGIAREASKLLQRAGRPPARDRQPPPDTAWEEGVRIGAAEPVDPYAGIPAIDPASVPARRTLDGSPAAPQPAALPLAADAGEQDSGTHGSTTWVRRAVRTARALTGTAAPGPTGPAGPPGPGRRPSIGAHGPDPAAPVGHGPGPWPEASAAPPGEAHGQAVQSAGGPHREGQR